MRTLNLTTNQVRVLYELVNMTGMTLTEMDAEYGSDSIEDIVQRTIPELKEENVRYMASHLFDILEENL